MERRHHLPNLVLPPFAISHVADYRKADRALLHRQAQVEFLRDLEFLAPGRQAYERAGERENTGAVRQDWLGPFMQAATPTPDHRGGSACHRGR